MMKDARLKNGTKAILENCRLDNLIVDREVQINFTGDTGEGGKLQIDKEIDVIARFSFGGKRILLLFECEDSKEAKSVKKHYREYGNDVAAIEQNSDTIKVIGSTDGQIQGRHFRDVDLIRVCFVYGPSFSDQSYRACLKEAGPHSFRVWNHFAVVYYHTISRILGRWTRYELFKEFALNLEAATTFSISALKVKQKGKTMYLGRIHPGLLLKIAYVVRRASERTLAYQRMLSKDRIATIGEFISSADSQSFIPNAVIVVLDAELRKVAHYDAKKHELTLPLAYCSAWMIDGQHRAYGFLGTAYEDWTEERHEAFDLPVVVFLDLPEVLQTQTFININYFQKRIKANLLCDLATSTGDLKYKLTWPSLVGKALNELESSPIKGKVKISELHHGRPISLASLVQYGLLETLLGFKAKPDTYSGPLFSYAPFDPGRQVDSAENQTAFLKQVQLLNRFLNAVHANTQTGDERTDPWRNTNAYSLVRPTGVNALFMVLAKILANHPGAKVDLERFLRPLRTISFKRDFVAKMGGGWKGFRGLANAIIRSLNRGKTKNRLLAYGEKEKV